MNPKDKRKMTAHQNQQILSLEGMAVSHRQKFNKPSKVVSSGFGLLCASGGKCEGICREEHLHRPRYAGVKAGVKDERGQSGQSQWAERCPSAYEPQTLIGRKNS